MKVVYITGTPRSGSTVLNILLGDHPQMHAFGELCGFAHDWLKGKVCTCGAPAGECPFWSGVHAHWVALVGHDPVERYSELASRWERLHKAPRLILEAASPGEELREFLGYSGYLIQALAAVSGAPILVDSSKGPARAFLLSRLPDLELYLVHLVRDPRGVAWSMSKGIEASRGTWHDAPAWKSAAYWSFYNACAEAALAAVPRPRQLRIRYEDLVSQPGQVIRSIGSLLQVSTDELEARLSGGAEFPIHHQLAGNRMRSSGRLELRPDTNWVSGLERRQKLTIGLMVGLQMLRYGYRPLRGLRER